MLAQQQVQEALALEVRIERGFRRKSSQESAQNTNSTDTAYKRYSPAKRPTMADMASDEKVGADAKEAKSHLFGS